MVHAHDVSKQTPREKKNFHRLRLEQLLRIFRALQTSRVLHISMDARLRINQLLSIQVQCVKKHC